MFNRWLLVSTSGGCSEPVPELPDNETYLVDDFGPGTVTFKIPDGCNVVKLYYGVYHENEGEVDITAMSINTGVYWCDEFGYEGIHGVIYIGVTGGATYTLSVMTSSETNAESGSISISYSKTINSMSPTKTDYIK